MVLDHQYPTGWRGCACRRKRWRHAILGRRVVLHNEVDRRRNQKRDPRPGSLFHADLATHQSGQAAHDRQSEASAAIVSRDRVIGLREGFEQALDIDRGDADAGVGDQELEPDRTLAPRPVSRIDVDLTLCGELDRVGHQIGQYLPQATATSAR